ncbi:hypothetical protein DXA21_22810, partial [Parabacteroides distasonis]
GIYEIIIRTVIVDEANRQVNKIHKAASNLVKAQTQAEMIHLIMDDLTEEEVKIYKRGRNAKAITRAKNASKVKIYKRGRNAKAITRAKNASMSDYRVATGFEALMGWLYLTKQSDRMATGFEALMGWLYLTKQSDRMMELIKMAVSRFKNNEENKRG